MPDTRSLMALAAVLRTGSFESAAHELSVTPSAISQRIKALEEEIGAALIKRGPPATATPTGARLHRHAEEIALLESALAKDLGKAPAASHIKIATSADSLSTWLLPALAGQDDLFFELVVDDQDHSADWLRRGEVQAAITAHPTPVQGSDCVALGNFRYIASASPAFLRRYFPDGVTEHALEAAPALLFNTKDRLQILWAKRQFGRALRFSSHQLPSSRGFVDAALLGMGWGMNPEPLIRDHLAKGTLVPLIPETPLDVPLFWQCNRRIAPAIAPLTRAIRDAAKGALQPPS
ncbi:MULTISPECIES: LysR family transcriptional regulator ArgP [Halocynthiibacter]|uniref:LysR family transcriptional regulator ArgP n=1 Tax=Halocynthiibacter halioticoli TaxID=2986804 RepID=A0AAE3LUD5_9RHOB|nr:MULTISPECIES: LysR family transcriptional regulator ArgP [Halocynthiibacter]MCV6823770.1 LysR family transcriptional regulator ArgP [Halocynthiibacter halioticoli]MCW4056771.1 LysR family transcriptional regulator ArgP [Halocynthiibacter sp. SDUM655004]